MCRALSYSVEQRVTTLALAVHVAHTMTIIHGLNARQAWQAPAMEVVTSVQQKAAGEMICMMRQTQRDQVLIVSSHKFYC